MPGVLKYTVDGVAWQELLAGPKGEKGAKGEDSTVPGPAGPTGPTGPAIGAILTTKGDLAARDASDAVRLPVGTTGLGLVADTTTATGLRYASGGWETVAALANLPGSGNWEGRRIRVTGGLGLQVMLWNGTAWVVDPVSDTGWQTLTLATPAGFSAGPLRAVLRRTNIRGAFRFYDATVSSSGAGTFYSLPTGWQGEGSRGAEAGLNIATTGARSADGAIYLSETQAWVVGVFRPVALGRVSGVVEWFIPAAQAWPTAAPT